MLELIGMHAFRLKKKIEKKTTIDALNLKDMQNTFKIISENSLNCIFDRNVFETCNS